MDKLLCCIRNIANGEKATYSAVTAAPALKLEVAEPAVVVFAAGMRVEDLTLPGHANMPTTQQFQRSLPGILEGRDPRWHLWEVRVYRHRLELDFADMHRIWRRTKAAALCCSTYLPEEMDLKIWTPLERFPCYQIVHLEPDASFEYLSIRYADETEGLVHTEVYEARSKKVDVAPMAHYPEWAMPNMKTSLDDTRRMTNSKQG